MLRLTTIPSGTRGQTLKAEGRLMGEWADLLEAECRKLARETQPLELDMGGVIDVDTRGLEALRRLQQGPVTLTGCTPILLALLAQEKLP